MSKQKLSVLNVVLVIRSDKVRYFCDCMGLLEVEQNIDELKAIGTKVFDERLFFISCL